MNVHSNLPARMLAATFVCAALAACGSNPVAPQVRTLSAHEVQVLRAGGGEELALPAELNGYPSPARALAWSDSLGLTGDQRFLLTKLNSEAQGKARALGERIVVAEQEFDYFMAAAKQPLDRVRAHLDKIAALRAGLRASLIEAHLKAFDVLTPEQREQYAVLANLPPPPVKPEKKEQPAQTPLY